MSHNLGRLVTDNRTVTNSSGIDLTPTSGPHGPARFVILHFDSVNLTGGAKLTVDLGYGQDVFTAAAGSTLWTRPANPGPGPIKIRIVGGTGSARLHEYGVGEPSVSPGNPPGTPEGSQTNPDVFLHTNPYQEPIYETRLNCGGFDWRNAACSLAPTVPDLVKDKVKATTGIIVEVHAGHVSSCSGTLIGADLFLTARHCLTDPQREDMRSASVSFDYHTNCDGSRPGGHVTRFFKVLEEVASGSAPAGDAPVPVASDWVVLRLDAAPGALPAPLPMRSAALMTGETIFTMHHPNGAAKKCQAGVHAGGTSISGFDYAGGSSGSSLFDVNGQVVGGPLANGGGCSVFYAPITNVIAGLATPPPPPAPVDVMVVFDRSGSMSSSAPPIGRTKLDEARDAASLFVQLVRSGAGDRLGLLTFSTTASLDAAPAPAATAKPDLVGPAPFTTGKIGAIAAGGATSIGAGLGSAHLALGGGPTDNAILLLTDGLQNTAPMIQEIEPHLGTTKINAIGFGSDADIDGPLLNRVAHDHGGHFTRRDRRPVLAEILRAGIRQHLRKRRARRSGLSCCRLQRPQSDPHQFDVCGEERITVILGWDDPATPLRAQVRTPSGKVVSERRVRPVRGRSWLFWRIDLPYQSERDGTWTASSNACPGAASSRRHPPTCAISSSWSARAGRSSCHWRAGAGTTPATRLIQWSGCTTPTGQHHTARPSN